MNILARRPLPDLAFTDDPIINRHIKNPVPLFNEIYERHACKVYSYITSIAASTAQADEYFIMTFMKIWSCMHSLRENEEKKIPAIVLSVCRPLRMAHPTSFSTQSF